MKLSQNNLLPQPARGSQASALKPRFKSSTCLSMRVEDPVNRRGGLKLGSDFLSRRVLAGILNQNLYFDMAS
jgi:hypothetical protein